MKRRYTLIPDKAVKQPSYLKSFVADLTIILVFVYFVGSFASTIIENSTEYNKQTELQYRTLPKVVTGDLDEGKYILLGKDGNDLIIAVRTFDVFYNRSVKDILEDVRRIAYIEGDDGYYNFINFIIVDEDGEIDKLTPRDISKTQSEYKNETAGLLPTLP